MKINSKSIIKVEAIKRIARKLPTYILLIVGIMGFQSITIYNERFCLNGLESNKFNCDLIKKTKIIEPGIFLLDNAVILKKLIQGGSTSGLIVDTGSLTDIRNRFKTLNPGMNFNYSKGSRKNAGYLLLSVSDPTKDGEPLIELWDLNKQEMVYRWPFNTSNILKEANLDYKPNTTRFNHPLLMKDGSIVTNAIMFQTKSKERNPIIKISPKGELININNDYWFHHSLEIDSQGKMYVPINRKNYSEEFDPANMGFAILDQELNTLKTYFLKDIFEKEGLNYILYDQTVAHDPFHLNDVEPLRNKSETNIVLLSLRNHSSMIAYDIKKEKVLWIIQGYTNKQHDVDILNEKGTHISIFDNNLMRGKKTLGNRFITFKNLPDLSRSKTVDGLTYYYASNNLNKKTLDVNIENFDSLDEEFIPMTITEGLSEYIIDNDSIFVEESNYGRLFELDIKTNNLLLQYANKSKNNNYYMMSWSRRLKTIPSDLIQNFPNLKPLKDKP